MVASAKKLSDMPWIVGVDEAGRGPIAGPVAVGLVMTSPEKASNFFKKRRLRDSKKMSERERKDFFVEICQLATRGELAWVVRFVSASKIDKIGINQAIYQALCSGVSKLSPELETRLELDAGLGAPRGWGNFQATIKGDERIPIIALASVVAKVCRDRLMCRRAKKFPGYGFERHKGYGTKEHYQAINRLGLTIIHRRSYLTGLAKKQKT